jgi:autotransporter-associated beta strand protein
VSIGFNAGNNALTPKGSITLNGTSLLDLTGSLFIGQSTGDGTLTLNSGTTVNANFVDVATGNSNTQPAKGTVNLNTGATINCEGDFRTGFAGSADAQATVNIDGGTLNVATTIKRWMIIGTWDFTNSTITVSNGGNLNLNANTDIRYAQSGNVGTHVINLNNGAITSFSDNKITPNGAGVLDLHQGTGTTGTSIFNLNAGGTLTIREVMTNNDSGTAAFNFNGGTLKATGATANFINLGGAGQSANILAGGAIIDSNGFNLTIPQPLASAGSDGGLTKQGAGSLTLPAASAYDGPTTITGGTLIIATAGTINTSSGVTINGPDAKLLISNGLSGELDVSTPVVLTAGTLDSNGLIDTVTIADNPANTVLAGAGGIGFLDTNTLEFQGDAVITLQATGADMDQSLSTFDLTTNGANGKVVINATNTSGIWSSDAAGFDYTIIEYSGGTFTGSASDFMVGTIAGLNPNQTASIVDTGDAIVLRIVGEPLIWTGSAGADWNSSDNSWDYLGSPTMFSGGSPVEFDDNASVFSVNIAENVSPSTVVFSNDINDYTLSSSGGFGITGSGSLVLNGSGQVEITTDNAFTGTTIINEGTLLLSGSGSIADSSSITVGEFGSLILAPGGSDEYANPISGAGDIAKQGVGTLTLSGANSFSGDFILNDGQLNLNSASALGTASGEFILNGGILDNTSGGLVTMTAAKQQYWDADVNFIGTDSLNMGNGLVTFAASRTVNVAANTLLTGAPQDLGAGYDLVKTGVGTLVLNGGDIAGNLDVQGGVVGINQPFFGAAPLGTGTLQNAGNVGSMWTYWNVSSDVTSDLLIRNNDGSNIFQLGFIKRGPGTLTLTNDSNAITAALNVDQGRLVLANTGTYGVQNNDGSTNTALTSLIGFDAGVNAVLDINGATVNYNNRSAVGVEPWRASLVVSSNGTGAAAINLTSGSLSTDKALGLGAAGSFGALNQSGGTMTVGGFLSLGVGNSQGVVNLSGGVLNHNGPMTAGGVDAGGVGLLNLGGTAAFNVNNTSAFGFWIGEGGAGILNIDDSATLTLAPAGSGIVLAPLASGVGTANLLGGIVTTKSLGKGAGVGIVNFNGGTLAANAASATFMTGLTSAYVHAAGGTIDNGGNAITIGQPLIAPTGNGVSAAGLTVSGGGYIGTPVVTITGDGSGATAVANIDANGDLTGITVTNPGIGYTAPPAFALVGGGIGSTGSLGGAATLIANASGGMTFTGNNITTLTGVNTYTGNTIINSGSTLVLGATGQLKFAPGANGVTNKVTGLGTVSFDGDFNIDLSGAAIANGNSWTLVDASLSDFDLVTFNVVGFTEGPEGVHQLVDGNNTWTFTESTGVLSLSVSAVTGFDSWIGGFGLDPADQDPTDDPDFDGLDNLAEYVLGGNPSVSNPEIAPTGAKAGGDFILTFNRTDLSKGDVVTSVEYGNSLTGWTTVVVPPSTSTVGGVGFSINEAGDPDIVTATIPNGAALKFFARVKMVK